jgi:hypothetical protein
MKARRDNRRRLLLRRAAGVSTVVQQNLAFFAPRTRIGFEFSGWRRKVDLLRREHDSKPVCTRRLQVHE